MSNVIAVDFRRLPRGNGAPYKSRRRAQVSPALKASLAFTVGYGVDGFGAEGGFVNNPSDPGGATYRGVTLRTFRVASGEPTATVKDLLAMSDAVLVSIYTTEFWNIIQGDKLPPAIALSVFDMAVTAGPYQAVTQLQRCVGATMDGIVGDETLKCLTEELADFSLTVTVAHLATLQGLYYKSLKTFSKFGKGWMARVAAREKAADALIPKGESRAYRSPI